MNVDDRLRRALHDEADAIEPDPQSWSRVETGVRRARRRRRAGAGLATAAVVVAALVAVPSLLDRDDARVETTPAHPGPTSTTATSAAPTSTSTTTSTTTTTITATPGNDVSDAIWPFTSQDQLDAYEANPGVGMFFDPEATALEFARTYLGMPDPVRDGDIDRTDADDAVVRVRPKPSSRIVTRVAVERFDGTTGPWSVTGATTDHIVLEVPDAGTRITSPVYVAGQSIAFEAVVRVEVREDGQSFGQSLGSTIVMGGGTEMAPFSGDITFDTPTATSGAIVLFTDSAEDGSIVEATVIRIRFEA